MDIEYKKPNSQLFRLLAVATLAAAAPLPAQAAEWELVPEVGLYAATIDNARLETDMEEDSSRSVVDARLFVNARGPRGEFRMEPRVRLDIYSDNSDDELDGEDVFLRSSGVYRWNSARAGFRSYITRESILRSEITDALLDDIDDPGPTDVETGRLDVFNETRTRAVLRPYVEFNLSPRSSLLLETAYIDVGYSGPPVLGRTEFDALQLSGGIVRRVDERNRVTARIYTSNYEADLTRNSTDTVGVEGEFVRSLNELWTMILNAGVQRNEFTFNDGSGNIDNATTSDVLGVALRRRAELTSMNLSLTRRIQPNASGFVVERDEFRGFVERRFTPRLTGRVGLRLYETATLDDARDVDQREDARFELNLRWALTQRWFVDAGYNYVSREFVVENRDADSNEFFLGINYRGLSRQ